MPSLHRESDYIDTTFHAATYDVQNITNEVINSDIIMTVQFISNSLALGWFVALQSNDGSPDEFRVLQRSGSDLTMTGIISAPPSTYTVYVYDLEQDGHINEMPAILPEDRIHITTTTISTFLKRAELYRRGSQVTVRCEFADEYPEASCVLVYRHYNNLRLTVKEYRRSTEFPVTVSINDTEMYTFAVFGKNGEGGIEPEPVIILKNKSHMTYPQPQTCK